MSDTRKNATISSMLWAAYGDALGFPTELAGPVLIKQRIGTEIASQTVGWTRLVGGRFGAQAYLPAGTYSDDTQLRLATCRAIRTGGFFDVESFAKIELPVWLAYSLGGGRGSKAAATSLGGKTTTWFSNFFETPGASYVKGGGNGAAMRVQPHIWAATTQQLERSTYLTDVVKNSVCTHGHARGLAGAVAHAANLAHVFKTGAIPEPEHWMDFAQTISAIPRIIADEPDLSTFWLPTWERDSGTSLDSAVTDAADEWAHSVGVAISLLTSDEENTYRTIVEILSGLSDSERGSGLKCALFALVAAWLYRDRSPEEALKTVVNFLDSDTDTIATMVGALLGALPGQSPPSGKIQDRRYLEDEAVRLFDVSQDIPVRSFKYPDLLYWQAPKTALDAVSLSNERLTLSGLGPLQPMGEVFIPNQKGTIFQWCTLRFGQTVLCKRRVEPKMTLHAPTPKKPPEAKPETVKVPETIKAVIARQTPDMFASTVVARINDHKDVSLSQPSLDDLTDIAIRSDFNAKLLGEHLLALAERENGVELALGYAAIVVKAKRARMQRRSS
jgi:ADP-ribosylglycohydrolase